MKWRIGNRAEYITIGDVDIEISGNPENGWSISCYNLGIVREIGTVDFEYAKDEALAIVAEELQKRVTEYREQLDKVLAVINGREG